MGATRVLAVALLATGLLAVAGCAPGAPRTAPATGVPLRVQVLERFYPVQGTSAARLTAALGGEGPAVRGRRWHAVTDFALRWRFLPREREGRCAAEDAALEVEIVTTLPRWEDRHRAAPGLASDWDLYLARLRAHEAEHQRIVMGEGRQLMAAVTTLEATHCRALRERARILTRRARGRVAAAHRAWDHATGYGVRAGAAAGGPESTAPPAPSAQRGSDQRTRQGTHGEAEHRHRGDGLEHLGEGRPGPDGLE